ncbi:MAG TPA: GTP 3',8-cyclase MoaA [Coriobacteriia bacterium]|nr:GTP 3',8-cyclase MoaA [Coriobacteriia bacterium]
MARDTFGRSIDYLRISLTDRCNLRCVYCMPEEGVAWKPHDQILTIEEIERIAAVAASEGIGKVRLTGGEPLVRHGVIELVRTLVKTPGIESVALTTNGTLLRKYAAELREAGLTRVNISLDSLDEDVYTRITRGGKLAEALDGIEAAFEVGFDPIKLNVVVVRSLEQDLLGFAKMTLDRPLHVRFIEYMPVGEAEEGAGCHGESGGWTREDTVPSDEVVDRISEAAIAEGLGPLSVVESDKAPGGWGPARYYQLEGAQGTVGVISPLSHHFCKECNRLRLTADGKLRPCLFSDEELDVREVVRAGDDEAVRAVIRQALKIKPENHHDRVGTERRMSQIGG